MVHLFTETELNPAIFNPATPTATTNQRRKLNLQDPKNGIAYGFVDKWDDGGTGNYTDCCFPPRSATATELRS